MLRSGGALAPISYSDSSPSWTNATYLPQTGIGLTNAFASYAAVYKAQPWVAALVNKLAFGTARLPLKVYERARDGSRSEARDSDLAKLLRNPNSRHDPFFFWLWTSSTFEVYGEALWVKVRPGPGLPPVQLWPLHPANVTTRHDDSARRAAAAFWKNGGRPGMTLTHPGNLSDPALNRLKAQWDAIHTGVDQWGKTAILEEGMTPNFQPLNAEELQYIESRKMNREEACGVFDVPPPVVHILDRATFSNITEQMRSMYRDTQAPRLGLYESVLDSQLRPDFDPQGKLYAEFLLDEVLRGAFEVRAAANQSAIFSGQRTPNEVRQQDNLPPMDGGDRLYIQGAAIPLEKAGDVPARRTTDQAALNALEGVVVCGMCSTEGPTSQRGLCRSCEGRVGRMLAQPKEIEQ